MRSGDQDPGPQYGIAAAILIALAVFLALAFIYSDAPPAWHELVTVVPERTATAKPSATAVRQGPTRPARGPDAASPMPINER